tara:strand:- start:148 stop:270 length:123 start_codon:yes stop_codon:yes gene_type:complete
MEILKNASKYFSKNVSVTKSKCEKAKFPTRSSGSIFGLKK